LILRPEGLPEERYELLFRQLDPVGETTGLQSRLKNLGLFEGEIDGVLSPATKAALRLFQRRENLAETGEPGPETLAALTRVHGS
jgi:peptidoglycan hydrolase-like protein with peptidoglycan-binding domain